jgi:hypothetical protein
MASYRGHLLFASSLGAAYGGFGVWAWNLDWGPATLAAGLAALGGLLPDLDSDSGVPVRELFGTAAAVVPILLYHRLLRCGQSIERVLVELAGVYLFIRFGVAALFKRFTVHRGMFHSIPALAIAGLAAYLLYDNSNEVIRWYVAGAVALGFLSHLVLDGIYGVAVTGSRLGPRKHAGSPLKFASSSMMATTGTYLVLAVLGGLTWWEWQEDHRSRSIAGTSPADSPPAQLPWNDRKP